MDNKQIQKIIKALPTPEELEDFLPSTNIIAMFKLLLEGDKEKFDDITLLGMLMGTASMLAHKHDDWTDFLRPLGIGETHSEDCEHCSEERSEKKKRRSKKSVNAPGTDTVQ